MAGVPSSSQLRSGVLSWQLGATTTPDDAMQFATGGMSLVLTGAGGAETARRLRQAGVDCEVRVDPAGYASKPPSEEASLFPNHVDWADLQRRAGVTVPLSPGVYVGPDNESHLQAALEGQQRWAVNVPGATLQIALHWSWLVTGRRALDRALNAVDSPVAILLADANDPLSKSGAVAGLAQLVDAHPDLSTHRCDLGALGHVALGGRHGAIGVSTTLRHLVPPDKGAGGRPGDRSPSVLLPELLSWLKGSRLAGLAAGDPTGRFRCDLPGCDGRPYREFRDPLMKAAAVVHNRHTLEAIARQILAEAPEDRFSRFQERCAGAVAGAVELSGMLRQDIQASPQLIAWTTL
jgi:hypothetical protein